MKHIKLFEAYNEDVKSKAESALEGLIVSIFPDQSYANPGRGEIGDYELDQDTDGDGTKFVFANVYLNDEAFKEIESKLNSGAGYNEYESMLNKEMPGGEFKVHNIGSAPADNMISISIAYE